MEHNRTKVRLSPFELELVQNAEILLTKNEIIAKVYSLFGSLAEKYVDAAAHLLPAEIRSISPKIARGENYNGLPYVMLDYPRYFKNDSTFAIRTFFWWGNFFSITLQLEGEYFNAFSGRLQEACNEGKFDDWYAGVGTDKWQHHFEEINYRQVLLNRELPATGYIKLSKKIPLQQWDNAEIFLQDNFTFLLGKIT